MFNFENIIKAIKQLVTKIIQYSLILILGVANLLSYANDSIDESALLNSIKYNKNEAKRLESYIKLCRHYVETLNPNTQIYLSDAILLSKQLNNLPAKIEANLLYARYYYYLGDIEESTLKIKEALIANEQLHSKKWFGEIYFQLGENYRLAGALDFAFENFKKSMEYAQSINDKFLISSIYNRYAVSFFENTNLLPNISRDSSLYYAKLSMDLSQKNNNTKYVIINYNTLGIIYRYKYNNNDTANKLFNTGLHLALKHNKLFLIPNISYNIARGYLIKNELDSTKKYIDYGYKYADSLQMRESLFIFYLLYANYYYSKGDLRSAYTNLQMYVDNYKKSVENKASFKVKSILSELQNRQQIIELEREEQTRNFLLIIASLLIIFFIATMVVMYLRNKHIRKSNLQLIEQNEIIEKKNAELDLQNKIIIDQNLELEETNASKDKLFSIISHDLKNPIGGLKEMITVLAENYDSFNDIEKKEILHELKSSSDNVLELLLGLLTWSRSQRNKIELDPYEQSLFQVIYQNVAIVSSSAKNKNISLINLVPENTTAFFDANMINTVVRNLLTNAIKFTNPGGKIIVKAEKYEVDANYVLVSISDNGVGIPKDKLDKLFQIKSSYTTVGTSGEKGTGLGLLIVWDFIEKNGGKIWVESNVGEGTTFYFTLPIKDPKLSFTSMNS